MQPWGLVAEAKAVVVGAASSAPSAGPDKHKHALDAA